MKNKDNNKHKIYNKCIISILNYSIILIVNKEKLLIKNNTTNKEYMLVNCTIYFDRFFVLRINFLLVFIFTYNIKINSCTSTCVNSLPLF